MNNKKKLSKASRSNISHLRNTHHPKYYHTSLILALYFFCLTLLLIMSNMIMGNNIWHTISHIFSRSPDQLVLTQTAGVSSITLAVTDYIDDVNQIDTSLIVYNSNLWLGNNNSLTNSFTGLRFQNVLIPPQAVIDSAELRLYSSQKTTAETSAVVAADASSDSVPFSLANKPSQRPITTAKYDLVFHTNQPWKANQWISLTMNSIIQEVINLQGWKSGNSLSLIIKGTGKQNIMRSFASTDRAKPLAPRLFITYHMPSVNPTPTPNPTITPNPTAFPSSQPTPTSTPQPTPIPTSIPLSGNTFYVSPTGNDSNPGTEDRPWKTINKAANILLPGQTVLIKGGNYYERVIPARSGTNGSPITYAAYPGNTVLVDGSGVLVGNFQGLFDLSGKSYITLRGLNVINSKFAGIFADSANHLIIEKNHTYNSVSSGIGIWSSNNIMVDGNDVQNSCSGGNHESITIAQSSNFEVKNNQVHNEGVGYNKEGIDAKQGVSYGKIFHNTVHDNRAVAIYVDSYDQNSHDIEVFNNVVYNSSNAFVIASEAGGVLTNVKHYNNIAYNNRYCGLKIFGKVVTDNHQMQNIQIINNTFANNGCGIESGNDQISGSVIRNNILSQNGYQLNGKISFLTCDHNVVNGSSYESCTGNIAGNPLLTSDYHLTSGSIAIDKGSSIGAPSVDFAGTTRPRGAGFDIGAYEY